MDEADAVPEGVWMQLVGDQSVIDSFFIGPTATIGDVVQIVCTGSEGGKLSLKLQVVQRDDNKEI